LSECEAAIRKFVEYVRANEPKTLLYISLQERDDPTRFLHYFIFEDEAARDRHSNSKAVDHFTGALYPNLVEPVEFTEYKQFTGT
jgi:quinol monooxygenase YgiN